MDHYFIKGTIKISVGETAPKIKLIISPCVGYFVPDVPKDKPAITIAFPNDCQDNATPEPAKLFKLTENELGCDASKMRNYLPALITIAAQQKPVELHLDFTDQAHPKIIGFVFPTK